MTYTKDNQWIKNSRDKKLLDELNHTVKNQLLLVMVVSGASGFVIGIILASFLHKFIVHPLGY